MLSSLCYNFQEKRKKEVIKNRHMDISDTNIDQETNLEQFNLEHYASQYEGYTKLLRLQFIANTSVAHRIEAYGLLYRSLKGSLYSQFYLQSLNGLKAHLNESNAADLNFYLDDSWVHAADSTILQRVESLDHALSDAKSKMVKESIRSAMVELAQFHHFTGNLSEAMKWILRCREFCSTPRHHCDMTLNIYAISIDSEKYFHANNNFIKAADCGSDNILLSKLRAASAIVSLNEQNFKIAAHKFLSISTDLGRNFNTTITCEDIALYGGLLSIATFDRSELRKYVMVERKYFLNNFLPLFPVVREIVLDFYHGRYSLCLRALTQLKPRLLLDIHLSRHTTTLLAMITDRCILQYCTPYSVIDLNRMTTALDMDVVQLEALLEKLISEDKLQAMINSQTKTIRKKRANSRGTSIEKVLQLADTYSNRLKRDILQLSLLKQGFVVDPKEDEFNSKYDLQNAFKLSSNDRGFGSGPTQNSTSSFGRESRRLLDSSVAFDDEDDMDYLAEDGEDGSPSGTRGQYF